jgi:hypothetical protein
MEGWIIFTATVAAIGTSVTLFVFVRQLTASRKRIVVKIYHTLIYTSGNDEKLDIVVNVKNLKGRIVRVTKPSFLLSNDDYLCPDKWESVTTIPNGSDKDFIIEIEELYENLKREYPDYENIKIIKYSVGEVDRFTKDKSIPRSIQKSFQKRSWWPQIF